MVASIKGVDVDAGIGSGSGIGSDTGTGSCGGSLTTAAVVALMLPPHFPQNFVPGLLTAPQAGHDFVSITEVVATGTLFIFSPQPLQNLALSAFSTPQRCRPKLSPVQTNNIA